MSTETIIVWADGQTQNALEIEVFEGDPLDVDFAATKLGCEFEQVNQCSPGEMRAYGVALRDDVFQAPAGLSKTTVKA